MFNYRFLFLSLVISILLINPYEALADKFWIQTVDQDRVNCLLLKIESQNLICYNERVTMTYDLKLVKVVNVFRNGKNFRIDQVTEDKYSKLATGINNIYQEQVAILAQEKKAREISAKRNNNLFADNSGYGLGTHRPSTSVNVRKVFEYRELLKMSHSELHDIYMYVIRNEAQFPDRYLSRVDSASKFVRLQDAEDRVDRAYERGDSVSDIMDALNDYGEAWVDNEMN